MLPAYEVDAIRNSREGFYAWARRIHTYENLYAMVEDESLFQFEEDYKKEEEIVELQNNYLKITWRHENDWYVNSGSVCYITIEVSFLWLSQEYQNISQTKIVCFLFLWTVLRSESLE